MGAPYSPPPLWPAFLIIGGFPIWGYLCGRISKLELSVTIAPMPIMVMGIFFPSLFSSSGLVGALTYMIYVLPGYAVGFLHKIIKSRSLPGSTKGWSQKTNVVLGFFICMVYVAALSVAVMYNLGLTFPANYITLTILVTISAIILALLIRKTRKG